MIYFRLKQWCMEVFKPLMTKILAVMIPAFLLFATSFVHSAISGDVIEFRSDSPQRYQVVEGDTLWDISGRFLEEPWLWPEVWQSNPQIENPDLIYPGNFIEIIYVEGRPRLTLSRGDDLQVVKLSPQIRREPLLSAIPTISLGDIEAFLSRNRVMRAEAVNIAPSVIGAQSGRSFSIKGEIIYVSGGLSSREGSFDIVRPGGEIKDSRGRTVAIKALVIGSATMLSQDGSKASLMIDENREEITEGDRLLPKVQSEFDPRFFPKPPSFQIEASIVDIQFGMSFGGSRDTVIIDVGERDRIEAGDLLTMKKDDHEIGRGRKALTFTGENYGTVLVYKTYRDYSLALVLKSEVQINLNDRVVTP